MAMRVPATDYEMGRPDPGVVEREFDGRQNLAEGINGCDRMDTRFENTERIQVLEPRGDERGRPMPRDARFRQADNHGEWGRDTYSERLEHGMDGPVSDASYHGVGLPTRQDLSYPVNSNVGTSQSVVNRPPVEYSDVGLGPKNDGIDGDN